MILELRVTPKASRNLVRKEGARLKIYLTSPAQDGLANAQLKELLADYLKVKKYQIEIIKGQKSRDKLVKINA